MRAAEDPGRRFVKCSGDWITFGQMSDLAERAAGAFAALGLVKGDRIGVISETRDEVFATIMGCAYAGTVNVALNTFLKGEFLRYQLADSGATVLMLDRAGWRAVRPLVRDTLVRHVVLLDGADESCPGVRVHDFRELLAAGAPAPDPELTPADLLGLLYTSGTTGDPKGCKLSHGYYTNVPAAYLEGDRIRPGDRVFTAFPFFHTAGQVIIFMAGLCGPAELVYEPVFHASTYMRRAAEEEATVLFGVGAMALAILAQPKTPEDASRSFRVAQFQPLPPARQLEFQERFNTPMITEGYGQTECVPITVSRLADERHRDSIGRPAGHLDIRIVDQDDEPVPIGEVGEIVVRPKRPEVMFQGYWNKPEGTLSSIRNLWHHTGDFARQDSDGYIYFVDRKSDAIRRRGESISSFSVEAAIRTHPAVQNVAVIGVASDMMEDEVKVILVLHEGSELTPGELFDFCKDRMPYFAMPRFLEFRAEIPVNPLGKVLKHKLRAEGITADTIDLRRLGLELERHQRR
jgi:crotonobetaine/carnitine-CoA ligase